MSTAAASGVVPGTRRVPMSWEEYLDLDESVRGEYVDGALVVTPAPSRQHQEIVLRLVELLRRAAGQGQNVTTGWGWQPPTMERGEFIPDVMVFPDTDDEVRFTGVPLLAVEVLSSDRVRDLVEKATKYARHGLVDYWVVDPVGHQVLTHRLVDGSYVVTGEHTSGRVPLTFAGNRVEADVDALLA